MRQRGVQDAGRWADEPSFRGDIRGEHPDRDHDLRAGSAGIALELVDIGRQRPERAPGVVGHFDMPQDLQRGTGIAALTRRDCP